MKRRTGAFLLPCRVCSALGGGWSGANNVFAVQGRPRHLGSGALLLLAVIALTWALRALTFAILFCTSVRMFWTCWVSDGIATGFWGAMKGSSRLAAEVPARCWGIGKCRVAGVGVVEVCYDALWEFHLPKLLARGISACRVSIRSPMLIRSPNMTGWLIKCLEILRNKRSI